MWAASCAAVLMVATLGVPGGAFAQQAPAAKDAAPAAKERVRVPTSYANVHMGPTSGQQILVLVPKGTVLTMVDRRGEWIQVVLTPELRKTGIVMRWYKNEERGWMHDSTVEFIDRKSP